MIKQKALTEYYPTKFKGIEKLRETSDWSEWRMESAAGGSDHIVTISAIDPSRDYCTDCIGFRTYGYRLKKDPNAKQCYHITYLRGLLFRRRNILEEGIQDSSIESYKDMLLEGKVGKRQGEVLWAIENFPDRTDQEIRKILGAEDPNYVRPRRFELANMNPPLIISGDKKICSVSGKKAMTWKINHENIVEE